jgi:hypothetical protein
VGPKGDPAQVITGASLTGSGSSSSPLAVSFGGTGSANTAARSDHTHRSPLGEGADNPATHCVELLTQRPGIASDFYWLKPSTTSKPFRAYCDMVTDGGGWTLVWSNLRGMRGKPATELQWNTAINTPPIYSGAQAADPESFMVYTGLKHWTALAPGRLLRYSWADDYGSQIDQSYRCTFALTGTMYTLGLSGCTQLVGSVVPGLFSHHNNNPFSTYDRDNDSHSINCAALYSETPFWYSTCWYGSINGGGEAEGDGHFNGAHWIGDVRAWGTDDGVGAGNGWMFVK